MRLEHLLSGEDLNRRFLVLRLFVSNNIDEKDEAESNKQTDAVYRKRGDATFKRIIRGAAVSCYFLFVSNMPLHETA